MAFAKQMIVACLVGAVIGSSYVGVKRIFATKPAPQKSAQELCVDDAMKSYSKQETAKMALALHFHRTDRDHLIKYIDTRDAVKATYCQ